MWICGTINKDLHSSSHVPEQAPAPGMVIQSEYRNVGCETMKVTFATKGTIG